MSFYGRNFVYNGTSSEIYGLICASTQGGEILSPAGSSISILEEYITRRETPYFYGVSFPQKLQFEIEFYSETEISRQKVREIERWLFGLSEYKEFYVIQDDMEGIHYNCLFTDATLECVGNVVYGFHATCVCDAPWAWGEEVTHTKETISGEFTIVNTSDNTRFTKPIIKLYFDANYAEVSIENSSATVSGSSNAMVFETVTAGEIIQIDTDLRVITSNKASIVDRFNGKYMYLVSGENSITTSEELEKIEITYTPARKVGS